MFINYTEVANGSGTQTRVIKELIGFTFYHFFVRRLFIQFLFEVPFN
jgi:hypothetical protein